MIKLLHHSLNWISVQSPVKTDTRPPGPLSQWLMTVFSIHFYRLDGEPTKDDELWGSQSDLRATTRSASHPDLCVVGQALHRD